MKKKLLGVSLSLLVSISLLSQGIGIGTTTPDISAALDVTAINKGVLIPRMNTSSILAIPTPARGLLVYDSLTNQLMVNTGRPTAPVWQPVASNNSGSWSLTGNSGTNPANQFVGTTDNRQLRFRVNNIQAGELHPVTGNIFWGLRAGQSNTTGFSNVAIGAEALKSNTDASNLVAIGDSALFHNGENSTVDFLEGIANTAIGSKTLFANTNGSFNTAVGNNALRSNIGGRFNTATGSGSLSQNTMGEFNTASGVSSLTFNTTGVLNTATGFESLRANTSGFANTAYGSVSLRANTTGGDNVAIGFATLNFNVSGDSNTAVGSRSLIFNTGRHNTGTGANAVFSTTTGNANTGVGTNSMYSNTTGSRNTAVGTEALFSNLNGNSNTAVGFGSDVSTGNLTNATAIGNGAIVNASNKIRLGNGAVTVIEGQVPFTTPSDGRFKFKIKEDVRGLDFIMHLRPVTYQFDVKRFDELQKHPGNDKSATASNYILQTSYDEASAIRRTGFIAQEVEKAANSSRYDFSGIIKPKNSDEHYSLSYESFVVPLVKAVQEQQEMIVELKKNNAVQKDLNESLLKRLELLESRLNKSSRSRLSIR